MVLVTKYTSQNEVDIPNTNKSALFVYCSGKLKIMDDTGCIREISCGYDHCVAYPRVQILVVGAGGKGSSSCTAICAGAGGGGGGVYYNPSYELCEDTYCIYVGYGGRRLLLNQGGYGEPSIFGPGTTGCAYIYAGGGLSVSIPSQKNSDTAVISTFPVIAGCTYTWSAGCESGYQHSSSVSVVGFIPFC